jgi:hypothetical protein
LYEDKATQLKKELAKQYDCPLEGKGWIHSVEKRQARKAAAALLRFPDKIPENRQKELALVVKEYQMAQMEQEQKQERLDDDKWRAVLEKCSQLEDVYRGPDFIDHGTYVIRQLMDKEHILSTNDGKDRWPELETFIRLWRQHFLDHLEPKYLSTRWTVDGEIYNH